MVNSHRIAPCPYNSSTSDQRNLILSLSNLPLPLLRSGRRLRPSGGCSLRSGQDPASPVQSGGGSVTRVGAARARLLPRLFSPPIPVAAAAAAPRQGRAAGAWFLPPLFSPSIPAAARRQVRTAGARLLSPLFSSSHPRFSSLIPVGWCRCGTRAAARQRRLSGDDDDSDMGGALATLTTTVTTEGLVDNDGARWTATSGSGTTSSIHRATSISAPSHLFTLPRLAPLASEGRWRADLPPPVLGSDGGA